MFILLSLISYTIYSSIEYIITGTAVTTNNMLLHIWYIFRWGAPSRLLSDQGREFVNKLNEEVCKEFSIRRSVTSAYHLQTNGLDKPNFETAVVNKHQNNWCDFLEVAHLINTQKTSLSIHRFF